MEFEILALDSIGNSKIKNEGNLIYSIMSNGDIWKKAKINGNKIIDSELSLNLSIKQITHDENEDISIKKTFKIKINGEFENLEKIRITILEHLKSIDFDKIYILNDDISAKIACDIYPKINMIENLLRKYTVKFLVTKLGPSWWEQTADTEMKKKSTQRTNNETVFGKHINNDVYKIDFGELGKIIYLQSSGFISKEHIINKVLDLEENGEAIQKLKKELKSNYTKFFKENFKDNAFQEKWEKLEKLRHKVAHNNLFIIDDLNISKTLTDELEKIISSANESIDKIQFDLDDKDAIRENINSNNEALETISKETIIEKLKESEKWASEGKRGGFVSFKHFVVNHLGSQGYYYTNSNNLINELIEDGVIEKYEYQPADKSYNPVLAIKLRQ